MNRMMQQKKSGEVFTATAAAGLRACLIGLIVTIALSGCDSFIGPDTRAERARALMNAGDYRRAMTELKTALEREPKHSASRLLLAELSLLLGDVDAASKELDRAVAAGAGEAAQPIRYELLLAQQHFDVVVKELERDERTPPADRLLLKAQAEAGLRQYADAERTLEQALRIAPEHGGILLQKSRVLAAAGRGDEALALAKRISEPDAARARALSLSATIMASRGNYAPARDLYTQSWELARRRLGLREQLAIAAGLTEVNLALQDPRAASASLDLIDDWAADSLIAHYLRARIALVKNEYAVAVAECQRALAIDPDHVASRLLLAVAHVGHGSVEQGEAALQNLLSSDPENLPARKLLAQVYLMQRRPADARRLLQAPVADSHDDSQMDWLMGAALTQSGETQSGLAYLERGAAGAAADDNRRLDLAAAYLGAGAPEKARELLRGLPKSVADSNRATALLVASAAAGKDPASARQEIEWLVSSSSDPRLQSAAGAYLFGLGDTQRSEQLLEQAVAHDPKALDARLLLALLAAKRSDWGRASKHLDAALAADPTYQPAYLLRAEIAVRRGDRAAAQQALEQAIGANPSATEPRLRLARLAFASNDPARGRDLLQQLVTLFPERAEVRNAVGLVLSQAGLQEEALVRFAEAGAAGFPEGMLNAARVHVQLNRLEQASESASTALALRPDWPAARRLLIDIDVRRGLIDRALAQARRAAGASPAPGAIEEIEGDIYLAAKRFDSALAAYEKAHRARPASTLAMKIFRTRQALNREPVEASLLSWLERQPGDIAVRRVLAARYESTNRRKEAIAQYERTLKLAPDDAALLNNLAWLLHLEGDSRARELARRAYELNSYRPEISDTYGWLLVQTGEARGGLEVLEKALAGAPSNPDIRYHVAAARARTGDRAGAVEVLDALLRERVAFASRSDAERLLQSLQREGA